MEKSEALQRLAEIDRIVHSSDHTTLSSQGAIFCGLIMLLAGGARLTYDLINSHALSSRVGDTTAFALVIVLLGILIWKRPNHQMEKRPVIHPLVKQAFGIGKAQFVVAALLSLAWWNHLDRVMAIWIITFGLGFNLLGRFVHKNVVWYSWTLISGGILVAGLSEFGTENTYLIDGLFLYTGLWLVGLSLLIKKTQASTDGT